MNESEVIRKTLRLTPELVEAFARLRHPDDQNETETFARLLQAATSPGPSENPEARQGASAGSGAPGVSEADLETLHEALSSVSKGVQGLSSTLAELETRLSTEGATEARRALGEEAQRFRTALQEHSAWFDAIESGLQKSHDSVARASVGLRELLPAVQTFAAELTGLQEKLATAHKREHMRAEFETRKLVEDANARFRTLAQGYEQALASIVGLPERLSQEAERMTGDLVRYRSATSDSFQEQLRFLKGAHQEELKLFRAEAKKAHMRLTWIFGVPTAVLMVILAFLFFGRPMFEKYEADKLVREVLEPAVQKYATDAIVNQNKFLEKLQLDLDKKINDVVAKQGLHVENAVKEFRKNAFDAHQRAGVAETESAQFSAAWKAEREKNAKLMETNADLAKKAQGAWGFWDAVGEHTEAFFAFLLIAVSLAGFLGYKLGKR